MKTYIVTLTKALGKQAKVKINANSKKEVIENLSLHFGLGITPVKLKNIVDFNNLTEKEKSFFYPNFN